MSDDFVEITLKKARLDFKLFEIEASISVFKKKLESMTIDETSKPKIIECLMALRDEVRYRIFLLEILRKYHDDQKI